MIAGLGLIGSFAWAMDLDVVWMAVKAVNKIM